MKKVDILEIGQSEKQIRRGNQKSSWTALGTGPRARRQSQTKENDRSKRQEEKSPYSTTADQKKKRF